MKKILSAVMAMVMLFTLGLAQISAEEATAQESVKFYSNGKTYNLTNGQVIHATAEGKALIGATVLTKDVTVAIEDGEVFFESSGKEARQIGFPLSTNGKKYKYFKLHIKSAAAFTGINGLRVNLEIPDSKGVLTTYLYKLGIGSDGKNPLLLDILAGEHDYYLDVTKFTAEDGTALTVEDTAKVSRFYLNDQGWHGDITWGLGECEFTNNSVLPLVTMDTAGYENLATAVGGVGNPISAAKLPNWTYDLTETNADVRYYNGPANNWQIINYRGGLAFKAKLDGTLADNTASDSNAFMCFIYTSKFKSKADSYNYLRFWIKTEATPRPIILSIYDNLNPKWNSYSRSYSYTIPANYEGWFYLSLEDIVAGMAEGQTLKDVNSIMIRMRDWKSYADTIIFDEVELCTSNAEQDLRCPVVKSSTFVNEPGLAKKTSTSVKFEAVEGLEYSLNGIDWQTTPEFTGLSAGKYLFYVRNAADPFGPGSVPMSIQVHKMGDIDGNGKVDASDITILKQKLLGIDVEADRFAVDVTENGVTDILDLVKIKKLSVTA